jgi:hypothetical protein
MPKIQDNFVPPTGFRRLSLTVVITKRYKIDNQKVQYITVIV